ncbi:MAG: bifunctional folylpolyglutamate synthase/dihydrofolate synthase [Chloroflexi bacterium]|nr:bifunctional folylpolyglutamate synthase/dihydrofolate synthase [Chloroflexota bacterium]
MTYSDALTYIFSFTNFEVTPAQTYTSKTFDLTRMERLLTLLGEPQRKFQSIHVAGTKGKGSTAAMIESILRAANHSTAFYTSPHLHTFRERIRVNGEMISKEDVVAGVQKLKPIVDQVPGVTTFEVMTALAFDYFAARDVEFAVLEVGLGGRLDATNVVAPRVAVITSISYDHVSILGNTLTQIAAEKAGIIKPAVPVVSSPQQDEARAVIENIAYEKNAPLIQVSSLTSQAAGLKFQVAGVTFQVTPAAASLDGQTFRLESATGNLQPMTGDLQPVTYDLKLLGNHQLANAATALAACLVLQTQGVEIPIDAMREGIRNVEWHGRFEILSRQPYLIIDGAHNGDSARQLARTLRNFFPQSKLHLIFGASGDKDIPAIFAELLPHVASLTLTRSHNPRAADLARLADLAAPYHVEMRPTNDLAEALRVTLQDTEPNDVVCVTGSLFVVAEAREIWLAQHGVNLEKDE